MSNFLKKWAPALVGAATGAITSGMPNASKYSAALSAGAGALTAGATKGNVVGGALQGFGGGAVGSAGANYLTNNSAPGSFGQGVNNYISSVPGFGGFGSSNPTGAIAKMFPQSGGNAPVSTFGGTQNALSPFKSGMVGSTPGVSMSNPYSGQLQAGMGSIGAGSSLPNFSAGSTPSAGQLSIAADSGGMANPNFGAPNMSSLTFKNVLQQSPSSAIKPVSGMARSAAGGGAGMNAAPQGPTSAMDMFKAMAPGMATSLMGNVAAGGIKAPDYSGVYNQLQDTVNNGGDPALKAAQNQYITQTLSNPNQMMPANAIDYYKQQMNDQLALQERDLRTQFQNANPGMNVDNNSAYLKELDRIRNLKDQNVANYGGQTQFQYDMQQQQNKAGAAQLAAQVNQMTTQQQIDIASLPIDQITMKYQVDAATAQGWKDAISGAGNLMMQKSLFPQGTNAFSQFAIPKS